MAKANRAWKIATVWVNAAHPADDDMLATLFHEVLHIMADDTSLSTPGYEEEYSWNRLGLLMAKAYRKGIEPE